MGGRKLKNIGGGKWELVVRFILGQCMPEKALYEQISKSKYINVNKNRIKISKRNKLMPIHEVKNDEAKDYCYSFFL